MVPYGPLAFFPGKLRHTNEILVLLGAGYYAQRSAGQAREIVARRLAANSARLREARAQHEKDLKHRSVMSEIQRSGEVGLDKDGKVKMGVFDIGNGQFEIREPYDSDTERKEEEKQRSEAEMRRKKRLKEREKREKVRTVLDAEFENFFGQLGGAQAKSKKSETTTSKRSPHVASEAKTKPKDKKPNTPTAAPKAEKINIIFLDVDGVLVRLGPHVVYSGANARFEPEALHILRQIIAASEPCRIVLSSNWKRTAHHRAEVTRQLQSVGIPGFIDVTSDSGNRQSQIAEWLIVNRDAVRGFVVLDDLDVASPRRHRVLISPHCVRTIPARGLTINDAKAAIQILRNEATIPAPATTLTSRSSSSHDRNSPQNTTTAKQPAINRDLPVDTPEARRRFIDETRSALSRSALSRSALSRSALSRRGPKRQQQHGGSRKAPFTGRIVERSDPSPLTAGGGRGGGEVSAAKKEAKKPTEAKKPVKKMSRFMRKRLGLE